MAASDELGVGALPPFSETAGLYPQDEVEAYYRTAFGNRYQGGDPTPAELTALQRGSGRNDYMRQLLAMRQAFGQEQGQGRPVMIDPMDEAMGMKQLTTGGAYNPAHYAYGPTKAGPFVFWPSRPPQPNYGAINTSLLASGLTNAFNNYLNALDQKKKPGEGETGAGGA